MNRDKIPPPPKPPGPRLVRYGHPLMVIIIPVVVAILFLLGSVIYKLWEII